MNRLEIIHILIDEFHDSNFGKIAMGLVSDKPHGKNVTQRDCNQFRAFLDQQFQAICKVLEGSLGIGRWIGKQYSSNICKLSCNVVNFSIF